MVEAERLVVLAASLARAAQQPPGLQLSERIIEAIGHRNRRTGRNERRMGIALNGCQTAAGRLEFERVAPSVLDGDDVRDTGSHAHALEDRGLDAGAPATVGGMECKHRGRGPEGQMLEHGALDLLLRPAAPLRVKWSGGVQVHATQAHNRPLIARSYWPTLPAVRQRVSMMPRRRRSPVPLAPLVDVSTTIHLFSYPFLGFRVFKVQHCNKCPSLLGFLHFFKVQHDPSVAL